MHVHTAGSFDSRAEPEAVFRRCVQLGLEPVVITDHDTIAEAVRLRARHPGKVVVGQEVSTTAGEVIGLFLEQTIPAGLDLRAALTAIKEQDGLIYLEHPFDTRRRCLAPEAIEESAELIDIVEVFNGRSTAVDNQRALGLQRTLGVAAGAGSDAHHLADIGSVYVELEDFSTASELLTALRSARIVRNPSRTMMAARRLAVTTIRRK